MALTIVYALPATVLLSVVIAGLPDSNITDTNPSVIRSPLQSQLATLPDGYVAHPEIGVAYKVYKEYVTWKTARARCISEGAHLAEIDTRLKFYTLTDQVYAVSVAWTGIHRIHNDTEWLSGITGLAVTNLPWVSEEPYGPGDCVYLNTVTRGLNNCDCSYETFYVCELPIPQNYNAQEIAERAETAIPGLPDFNTTNTNPSVTQSPLQSQLATLPDGYVAHPEIGVAYKVHKEYVPWKTAGARCISEGAHLAVIDTRIKFDILANQDNIAWAAWTGIHRIHNDTEWISGITGSAVTNLPWGLEMASGPGNCVNVNIIYRGLYEWHCSVEFYYVCELPIPDNYNAQGIAERTETVIPGLPDFNITNTNPSVIQSPLQSQHATLPDGYVAHPEIGVAYRVHKDMVLWKTARARCISEGAHLADIDTRLKFDTLADQISGVLVAWTGIHRIHNDTEWLSSITGLAVRNLPWASEQPSDPYDCVYVSIVYRGLSAYYCSLESPYVCELPIPENYTLGQE